MAGDQCVPKYRCCNSLANVSDIVNASITYFAEDGFFADNGAFGGQADRDPRTPQLPILWQLQLFMSMMLARVFILGTCC